MRRCKPDVVAENQMSLPPGAHASPSSLSHPVESSGLWPLMSTTATPPRSSESVGWSRKAISFPSGDLSFVQKVVPVHLDGIVGLDVLGGSPFTIDYTTREIRFGPFAGLASSTRMESKQGLPLVNATMNGQSVLLYWIPERPRSFSSSGRPFQASERLHSMSRPALSASMITSHFD